MKKVKIDELLSMHMYETIFLRCFLLFKIIVQFISRHVTGKEQDFVQPPRILNGNVNAMVIILLSDGFC